MRSFLTGVAAATALGVAGGAVAIHQWQRWHDLEAAALAEARAVAESATSVWPASAGDPRVRAERIADLQSVLAVGAFGREGQRLAASGRADWAIQRLPRAIQSSDRTPAALDVPGGAAWCIPVDARPASSDVTQWVCIIQVGAPGGAVMYSAAVFPVGIGLIALLSTVFAAFQIRGRVAGPLAWLAEGLADDSRRPLSQMLCERDDEIGQLARLVAGRRRSALKWRRKYRRQRKGEQQHVAHQTRDIRRTLDQVQREAEVDALTGVLNRRTLERRLDAMFDAQRRAKADLAILMFDVDHFKTLNDTLGHQAGDAILVFAGELIRQHLRPEDVAVRYGGDEFTLLLPNISIDAAAELGKRIVLRFAQRTRTLGVHPYPTLSAGVAGLWHDAPRGPSELLERADRALYETKRSGRGTVVVSSGDAAAGRPDSSGPAAIDRPKSPLPAPPAARRPVATRR